MMADDKHTVRFSRAWALLDEVEPDAAILFRLFIQWGRGLYAAAGSPYGEGDAGMIRWVAEVHREQHGLPRPPTPGRRLH